MVNVWLTRDFDAGDNENKTQTSILTTTSLLHHCCHCVVDTGCEVRSMGAAQLGGGRA